MLEDGGDERAKHDAIVYAVIARYRQCIKVIGQCLVIELFAFEITAFQAKQLDARLCVKKIWNRSLRPGFPARIARVIQRDSFTQFFKKHFVPFKQRQQLPAFLAPALTQSFINQVNLIHLGGASHQPNRRGVMNHRIVLALFFLHFEQSIQDRIILGNLPGYRKPPLQSGGIAMILQVEFLRNVTSRHLSFFEAANDCTPIVVLAVRADAVNHTHAFCCIKAIANRIARQKSIFGHGHILGYQLLEHFQVFWKRTVLDIPRLDGVFHRRQGFLLRFHFCAQFLVFVNLISFQNDRSDNVPCARRAIGRVIGDRAQPINPIGPHAVNAQRFEIGSNTHLKKAWTGVRRSLTSRRLPVWRNRIGKWIERQV